MFFGLVLIDDVSDGMSGSFQVISDETPMTTPPQRLSTHHRSASGAGHFK